MQLQGHATIGHMWSTCAGTASKTFTAGQHGKSTPRGAGRVNWQGPGMAHAAHMADNIPWDDT